MKVRTTSATALIASIAGCLMAVVTGCAAPSAATTEQAVSEKTETTQAELVVANPLCPNPQLSRTFETNDVFEQQLLANGCMYKTFIMQRRDHLYFSAVCPDTAAVSDLVAKYRKVQPYVSRTFDRLKCGGLVEEGFTVVEWDPRTGSGGCGAACIE